MKVEVQEPNLRSQGITFSEMPIQSFGVIVSTSANYEGHIVWKCGTCLVYDLTAKIYWNGLENLNYKVHLYPACTKIVLTQE